MLKTSSTISSLSADAIVLVLHKQSLPIGTAAQADGVSECRCCMNNLLCGLLPGVALHVINYTLSYGLGEALTPITTTDLQVCGDC